MRKVVVTLEVKHWDEDDDFVIRDVLNRFLVPKDCIVSIEVEAHPEDDFGSEDE
jgi:hypothetical protein